MDQRLGDGDIGSGPEESDAHDPACLRPDPPLVMPRAGAGAAFF
jgi:hypothetical protein